MCAILVVKSVSKLQCHRLLHITSKTLSVLTGAGRGQVEVEPSKLICQAFTHCLLGTNRGLVVMFLRSGTH